MVSVILILTLTVIAAILVVFCIHESPGCRTLALGFFLGSTQGLLLMAYGFSVWQPMVLITLFLIGLAILPESNQNAEEQPEAQSTT